MTQIFHIHKQAGRYIARFVGKNYQDSMLLADRFAKERGVTLLWYYEQIHGHKAILVRY